MGLKDTVRVLVPQGMRNGIRPEINLARRGAQKLHQMAGRTGRLPDFLVLGAQKAGTTTLYDLIMEHPGARPACTKEIAFFDRHHDWGLDWYRSSFPPQTDVVTGEATPGYLYAAQARDRIAATLPQTTKFVVLLRNPVDRAISHYHHERRLGYEILPLEQALDAEADRLLRGHDVLLGRRHEHRTLAWSSSYVDRGRYARQLEAYFRHFPRENFHIETSDRFFAEPAAVMAEVFVFLDLPAHEIAHVKPRNIGVYSDRVPPHVHARLVTEFAGSNADLERLLGRALPW